MNFSINRNLRFCCFVRDTKVAIIAEKIQFGSSQCMWLLNSKLNWIYTFSLIARITILHTFNLTNCIFTHKLFLRITCMWPQSKRLKIWIWCKCAELMPLHVLKQKYQSIMNRSWINSRKVNHKRKKNTSMNSKTCVYYLLLECFLN